MSRARERGKRARKRQKEKEVYVDKIDSIYLTDSHVWWVENLNSTATKKVAVPSSLFVFSIARLPRSLAPSHVFYPRPRDYLRPLLVKKLATLQTMHHSCLVPIRGLSRPSRSMHFSDVSGTNGPRDPKRIGRAQ